jgi:restriction system protein
MRARELCKHGIIGALFGGQSCAKCQEEKTVAAIAARKKIEEETAKKKADEERAYKEWVARIKLPEYLSSMDAEKFEHLICDLFQRLGYEVEHTPFSGDGGIDGYLRKNGQLSILQCKRVKGSVGQPVLRDLFGTMNHEKAKEGIVVTTGRVSKQAREWAQEKPIRILELDELTNLIRENYSENDVVPKEFVPYGKNSALCPRCARPLKVVKWKGRKFLGCTGYPRCRFTKSLGFRSLDSQKN